MEVRHCREILNLYNITGSEVMTCKGAEKVRQGTNFIF